LPIFASAAANLKHLCLAAGRIELHV